MTPREAFERVRTHLLAQGRRAKRGTACLYRYEEPGGSVLRCAVGCLVTDAAYDPGMERSTVDQLRVECGRWEPNASNLSSAAAGDVVGLAATRLAEALEASGVTATPEMLTLLDELQCLHDGEEPEAWPHALERLEAKLAAAGGP